jgi:hypothetical protein
MADYAGLGASLGAAEEAQPEPAAGAPLAPVGGLVAMGDVVACPKPVEPITDAATGVTYSADPGTATVTATRTDKTVVWTVDLSTRGVPADDDHLIRALVHGAKGLVICYGGDADGEPLQMAVDPATGKPLP